MTKGWDIVGMLAGLLISSCTSGAPATQSYLDHAFACIQVHEARIEDGRTLVARVDLDCAEVCSAAGNARAHETRLCYVAHKIADPDALTRCERAIATTNSIETQARGRCACAAR